MPFLKKASVIFIFIFVFAYLNPFQVISLAAGPSLGVAATYPISDPNIAEGDVVCFSGTTGALVGCTRAYDERIFGVYLQKPQVVMRQENEDRPVVREGRTFVNVTTLNGEIQAGEVITSSEIPGKAQKATEPIGYVLGRALGSFTNKDGEALDYKGTQVRSGQVETALVIGPQGVLPRGTILDKLGYILVKGTQTPQAAGNFFRYIMAGLLTISVSIFALNNFGRNINKGIESIGRNPLARSQIHFAILVNTIIVGVMVVGSIILGLVIIRI